MALKREAAVVAEHQANADRVTVHKMEGNQPQKPLGVAVEKEASNLISPSLDTFKMRCA